MRHLEDWNTFRICRFYYVSVFTWGLKLFAVFSPYVCVSGLFRRECIPYICDAKAGSRGVDPCPGTENSLLDKITRYTRCAPAKTKIVTHIIFHVCHRWGCDHCQSTKKYPHWVLLVVFLPILCSRLLRAVVPGNCTSASWTFGTFIFFCCSCAVHCCG